MELLCVALRQETPTIRTFCLRPAEPVPFEAGQALALRVPLPAGPVWRSFTISGAGPEGTLELTIKAQAPGGATRWLHDHFAVGQRIEARAPRGRFTLALRQEGGLALVSGGSGATPMRAMLASLAQDDPGADVVWLHFARSRDEVLFPHDLADWQRRMSGLRVVVALSRPEPGWFGLTGRPSRAGVAAMVPDFGRRQVFCCGPAGFMTAIRLIHAAEGGDRARFHTESFGAPPPQTPVVAPGSAEFRMTIAGREIGVRADESILQASLRQGVIIPCGCGEGMCGTCMVRLTAGQFETTPNGGLSPEEAAQGYVLACSTRAASDIAVSL
ncbi:flavin reductase family protein [Paenirhodobacter sp.]|uniref:flavin reductase family protein n=1 Tax=Paenirhodobacter sp. TaxID=1965326 RepID=UPI003B3CCD16